MTRLWRHLLPGVVAAALLAASFASLAFAAHPGARSPARRATPAPEHLLVYAQEYSLWPSRTRFTPGTIDVELWNRGQDSHDVRVRRLSPRGTMVGPVLGAVSITPSGAIHTAVWHLKAGKYEIYCSLPGHMKMGMHAKLSVIDWTRRFRVSAS